MIRRKKFEDEEDSHERWLISYADFITLLFAFFVVMYATSTINLNKYRALSSAVVTAFQGKANARKPTDMADEASATVQVLKPLPLSHLYQEKKQRDNEKMHGIAQSLVQSLQRWVMQKQVQVTQQPRGVRIDILEPSLFNADRSTLSSEGTLLLQTIVSVLDTEYRQLQVVGHSHYAKHSALLNSENWQAAARKAALVSQALVVAGVPEKRVSLMAVADTMPLASGDNPLARATNERTSIWILSAENDMLQLQDDSLSQVIEIDERTPSPATPTVAQAITDHTPQQALRQATHSNSGLTTPQTTVRLP